MSVLKRRDARQLDRLDDHDLLVAHSQDRVRVLALSQASNADCTISTFSRYIAQRVQSPSSRSPPRPPSRASRPRGAGPPSTAASRWDAAAWSPAGLVPARSIAQIALVVGQARARCLRHRGTSVGRLPLGMPSSRAWSALGAMWLRATCRTMNCPGTPRTRPTRTPAAINSLSSVGIPARVALAPGSGAPSVRDQMPIFPTLRVRSARGVGAPGPTPPASPPVRRPPASAAPPSRPRIFAT